MDGEIGSGIKYHFFPYNRLESLNPQNYTEGRNDLHSNIQFDESEYLIIDILHISTTKSV